MTRGIFALLTLAATLVPAPPAPAASPPLAVYEISRARRGGPSTMYMYVVSHSGGTPGVLSFLQLAPAKGGGWTRAQFMVGMHNASETRLSAYGAGSNLARVSCPIAPDICGKEGQPDAAVWLIKFRPAAGHRYLLAVRPDSPIYVPPQWRVRHSALGARVVYASDADAAGVVTANATYEAFYSADAPGGRYGSGAFGMVPCRRNASVGTAMLASDGSEPGAPISCAPGGYYGAFSGTRDGRKWTVTGPVVGEAGFPVRLLVFDYPKR